MSDRPSALVLVVGVVLTLAGWGAITAGWYQASRQELETGQLPYVVSGGFGGIGLILLGAAAMVVYAVQRAAWRQRQTTDALRTAIADLAQAQRIEQPPAPRRGRRRAM